MWYIEVLIDILRPFVHSDINDGQLRELIERFVAHGAKILHVLHQKSTEGFSDAIFKFKEGLKKIGHEELKNDFALDRITKPVFDQKLNELYEIGVPIVRSVETKREAKATETLPLLSDELAVTLVVNLHRHCCVEIKPSSLTNDKISGILIGSFLIAVKIALEFKHRDFCVSAWLLYPDPHNFPEFTKQFFEGDKAKVFGALSASVHASLSKLRQDTIKTLAQWEREHLAALEHQALVSPKDFDSFICKRYETRTTFTAQHKQDLPKFLPDDEEPQEEKRPLEIKIENPESKDDKEENEVKEIVPTDPASAKQMIQLMSAQSVMLKKMRSLLMKSYQQKAQLEFNDQPDLKEKKLKEFCDHILCAKPSEFLKILQKFKAYLNLSDVDIKKWLEISTKYEPLFNSAQQLHEQMIEFFKLVADKKSLLHNLDAAIEKTKQDFNQDALFRFCHSTYSLLEHWDPKWAELLSIAYFIENAQRTFIQDSNDEFPFLKPILEFAEQIAKYLKENAPPPWKFWDSTTPPFYRTLEERYQSFQNALDFLKQHEYYRHLTNSNFYNYSGIGFWKSELSRVEHQLNSVDEEFWSKVYTTVESARVLQHEPGPFACTP